MQNSTTTATVLIADDDRVTRQVLNLLLGQQGHRIEFANSGAAALQRAEELKPDLLLLDINMPDMDGFGVCRAIRATDAIAEMPIIMLTSLSDRAARLQGIEAGADDFISKPFDRIELAARVRTVLRLNRYRRLQAAHLLQQQLEMAAAIQQQLLPHRTPQVPGLSIATRYLPASNVGGDFFDLIEKDGLLYFVVADVSGHGIASAIFMSNARSALRSLLPAARDIAQLAEHLNTRMVEDSGDSGMFVSAVIGCYESSTRTLSFVNCGHPEPFIVRAGGRVDCIAASAAPIGMTDSLGATVECITVEPGDVTCLCTDGVPEAISASGEMIGMPLLQEIVQQRSSAGADEVADAITDDVRRLRGHDLFEDDVTLMVFRSEAHAG